MANSQLFNRLRQVLLPKADAINEAGGLAYQLDPKTALAQLAATGCFNSTFYASAETQLQDVLALAKQVDVEFLAKTAIYARRRAAMKDMPALLLAELSTKSPELLSQVFSQVIDSTKMLRNFVQILRSGAVGRRSLGTVPKRLVRAYLDTQSDADLFAGAVGNAPSLADVIKMVHPKPTTASRQALYAYLLGREVVAENLPPEVRAFEAYKAADPDTRKALPVPEIAFQYLTALDLGTAEWTAIAQRASWTMTRMNLNTFQRHGVFAVPGMTERIAARLRQPELVKKARAFPQQLLMAYRAASDLPQPIREALHDAMELALENVPKIVGKTFVLIDVSGSMHSPITGVRQGATTTARCLDVAALVASAILRHNPQTEVIPFHTDVVRTKLDSRAQVMANANQLAGLPSGGTNCSAPLYWLNERKARGELVIYLSDNESWVDSRWYGRFGGSATETLEQWQIFKDRNQRAKLVCIDLQPSTTTQAQERPDVINVGGFSDEVFRLLAAIAEGEGGGHWVREIERVQLQAH